MASVSAHDLGAKGSMLVRDLGITRISDRLPEAIPRSSSMAQCFTASSYN